MEEQQVRTALELTLFNYTFNRIIFYTIHRISYFLLKFLQKTVNLINKIPDVAATPTLLLRENKAIIGYFILESDNSFYSGVPYTAAQHAAFALLNEECPCVKVLPYLTRENGKLFLQALFKEMKYDVDWGDDNKFDVVDGTSTTTDDNGNTVIIGQKRLELPYFIGDGE